MKSDEKILDILRENPKGLGYNELRLKGVHDKFLRKFLPKHIENGFVRLEKKAVRGGIKHVHFLTDKGRDYIKMSIEIQKIENEFLQKFGIQSTSNVETYTLEKKLSLYEKISLSIIEDLLKIDDNCAVHFLEMMFSIAQTVKERMISDTTLNKKMLEAERDAFLKSGYRDKKQ